VRDVAINLHYLPEAIPASVGDGARFGLRVHYSYEPALLGTAGTVRALAPWLAGDDALVVYGDLLTDQPIAPLVAARERADADAALVLHRRAGSNSVVDVDDAFRILRFQERPANVDPAAPTWVNSGIQLLSARLVERLPAHVPADLPRDVYAPGVGAPGVGASAPLHLVGVPLSGFRVAIDSPARYAEADLAAAAGRLTIQAEATGVLPSPPTEVPRV
jgi:NDP-sugar pyrophosphorylase family protein